MMTPTQEKQFIRMYKALKTIGFDYQTPSRMQRDSKEDWGLGYEETIGMAYENIQSIAKGAVKGVRLPKPLNPNKP